MGMTRVTGRIQSNHSTVTASSSTISKLFFPIFIAKLRIMIISFQKFLNNTRRPSVVEIILCLTYLCLSVDFKSVNLV